MSRACVTTPRNLLHNDTLASIPLLHCSTPESAASAQQWLNLGWHFRGTNAQPTSPRLHPSFGPVGSRNSVLKMAAQIMCVNRNFVFITKQCPSGYSMLTQAPALRLKFLPPISCGIQDVHSHFSALLDFNILWKNIISHIDSAAELIK